MDVSIFFDIVPQLLPTFMLGLVALIGLLVQRKTFSEVLTGVIKTMAGTLILFTAVGVLNQTITPIATLFGLVYDYQGQASTVDWTAFLGAYGVQIVLVMLLGFLVNLVLARITRWKYVFLTGHIMFWNAFMVVAALTDSGQVTGVALILIGGLVQGVLSTLFPALLAPFIFKLTGRKDFTVGHTTTILAVIGALLGKWFGDPAESTEEMEVPEGLSFIKSMTVSTSITMFLLYLVMGFVVGLPAAASAFTGGVVWLWFLWIVMQGILFGGGLVILLTGVRMTLAEIVPAFHGIARKIVPDGVPALDCPMIFPYGQNALMIGFPIAMVASLVTLVIFGLAGYPYLLLPLVVAAFFDVGPAAVLANATGGRRGVVIASIAGGVLLIVFQALSLPFVMNTAAGFVNAFGGNDFSIIAVLVGGLTRLISSIF
ncbi:MAG: PTS ascorbate transporter subunit IIC [Anaerolineaceae bacterium]|nr:PTS ascorbate transporter subunit IIC [Anaerolineaceae bacterium]